MGSVGCAVQLGTLLRLGSILGRLRQQGSAAQASAASSSRRRGCIAV